MTKNELLKEWRRRLYDAREREWTARKHRDHSTVMVCMITDEIYSRVIKELEHLDSLETKQ